MQGEPFGCLLTLATPIVLGLGRVLGLGDLVGWG